MSLLRSYAVPLILAASVASACGREARPTETTIAIQRILAGNSAPRAVRADVWAAVRDLYGRRENAPLWMARRDLSHAQRALELLRTAEDHGLRPADYDDPKLEALLSAAQSASDDPTERFQQLADADVRLTTALLSLGHDVALGRTGPGALDRRWRARREAPDLAGTLSSAADGDLMKWPDTVRPQHAEYFALQKALKDLRGQQAKGGWTRVDGGPFAPGATNPNVASMRQRLAASGEIDPADVTTSQKFDGEMALAVRAFQEHHAIKATGVADMATLAEMNVPLADRIAQLEMNLERWRWMPDDFGARHLLVNIPSFHLVAREGQQIVKDIRVVVGKLGGHETPVFSSDLSTVVFSPYWNIPDSIVEGETVPALAREPDYLERHHIELLRTSKGGTTIVDPSDIDWDDPQDIEQLAFRQRPGPDNALGHVKFLFPNAFDVYLHDTPADSLFARPKRAFSHGCVRVEEPDALAQYVLRDDSAWTDQRIRDAMNAGVEQQVTLKNSIPVHIVYFTAWVDEQGGLHLYPDAYGYDAKQRLSSPKAK